MSGRNQPRRAARVDSNQSQIVVWLKEAGAHVVPIGGTWDLFVGLFGRWDLVEVKQPDGTVKQSQFLDAIQIVSKGLPPPIIGHTAQDVIQEMKRRAKEMGQKEKV